MLIGISYFVISVHDISALLTLNFNSMSDFIFNRFNILKYKRQYSKNSMIEGKIC